MADYVVTGHIFYVPERYQYPWNVVEPYPYGATISIDLAPADETKLIDAHVIVPKAWTTRHLYPY